MSPKQKPHGLAPWRDSTWRLVYRIDFDAVVIVEVFSKTTQTTPKKTIDTCKLRLSKYDLDGK